MLYILYTIIFYIIFKTLKKGHHILTNRNTFHCLEWCDPSVKI